MLVFPMTKVQLQFALTKPLDGLMLDQIARVHAVYGLARVQMNPSLDALTVDYDASRLTAADVEAALHRAGLPVERR